MLPIKLVSVLFFLASLAACVSPATQSTEKAEELPAEPSNRVVLSSEIVWEALNPARGDKSPQAGTIWGDRKGTVATGFLAKFVDGFSSPPHIHNVTYRAMVLKGLIHNDDPEAANMWMPTGSFWTQPAGEVHITSAQGEENIAYVEIDRGPYLVKPTTEAFDEGERPINVDFQNMVWLDASQTSLIESEVQVISPTIAFLWEQGDRAGYLLKLPAGYEGTLSSEGNEFHAVIIAGTLDYPMPNSGSIKPLDPGSYFTSSGRARHTLKVSSVQETLIYLRSNGSIFLK